MMRPQTLVIALLLALAIGTCKSIEPPGDIPETVVDSSFVEYVELEEVIEEEPPAPSEVRALWVARMAYKTPEDVRTIIRNAHAHHFNVILWQVRGNGTTYYPSAHEPWAWELTGSDPSTLGQNPGWDPLGLAVEEAHALGMELHAWVNVFPAWKQTVPPPAGANQLWNEHPEWFMQDQTGGRMWPQDWWTYWYTFLDPGVPEVRAHLLNVFSEIAASYAVDGLHFDYIRYPAEVGDWGHNPTSIQRFQEYYKDYPDVTPARYPEQWAEWKRTQITELVNTISREVRRIKPSIMISSAVLHNWSLAHNDFAQDARTWLSRGTLDASFPMLYHYKPADFSSQKHLDHPDWSPLFYPDRHYCTFGIRPIQHSLHNLAGCVFWEEAAIAE